MRVIILDWDGVLATRRSYDALRAAGRSWREPPFDADCLARFKRLLRATNAKVVLATAWRSVGSVQCGEWMRAGGVECELIGCTPWLKGAPRRVEIRSWIDASRITSAGTVPSRYVVIDDDPDADLGDGCFIQTDMTSGLTDADVDRAVALLTA